MRFASASALSLFVALALLVATGVCTGVDQWAVDHLAPGAVFTNQKSSLVDAVIPLWATHWSDAWSVAVNLVTLPASVLVALAITAWRAPAVAVAVFVGTAIEALFKHTLTRPALYDHALHITGFDTSFPSGHTLRTVLVAAVLPRPLGVVWAVASIVLLQLAGWHTPTDIAGGLLLALGLLGARGALRGRRLARAAAR